MPVDIHTTVRHSRYGEGDVIQITDENVYVLFREGKRIFPYPDAFDKGYLSRVLTVTKRAGSPLESLVELLPEDIKHYILVVKVNLLDTNSMDRDALYSIVRGIWEISKERAEKVEYVFGVSQSLIVAVYKPTKWFICKDAKDKLPRKDIVLSSKNENWIFFVDKSYERELSPDENQKKYFGKSIAKLVTHNDPEKPFFYLYPKEHSPAAVNKNSTREIILDAADYICHDKIYKAINETVGTSYTGWMKASWPSIYPDIPFRIWFPKLAEEKNGKLASAAFDCVNTISADWNELIFDDLKDTPPENNNNHCITPVLIFAKEPKGGPYVFRGVYLKNPKKSRHKHHVFERIGSKVRLRGQPADNIEILDDFRQMNEYE